jgi:hypothetical protein
MKKMKRFWLVVLDDDKKQFQIEGPMTNDDTWNEAVCRARQTGRDVHCTSPSTDGFSQEALRAKCLAGGYTEASEPIVNLSFG